MHVIATTSQKNADFVKALGANEIIEYDVESFEEAVERGYFASESEKVDLVIDPLGYKYENFTIKKAVLKNDGWYVNVAGSDWAKQSADWFHLAIPEAQVRLHY